jgi:hypothetical protein
MQREKEKERERGKKRQKINLYGSSLIYKILFLPSVCISIKRKKKEEKELDLFVNISLLTIQYLVHIRTLCLVLLFFCIITGNNIIEENAKDKITSR